MLCGDLSGKEIWKWGDICICIANSFCHTAWSKTRIGCVCFYSHLPAQVEGRCGPGVGCNYYWNVACKSDGTAGGPEESEWRVVKPFTSSFQSEQLEKQEAGWWVRNGWPGDTRGKMWVGLRERSSWAILGLAWVWGGVWVRGHLIWSRRL